MSVHCMRILTHIHTCRRISSSSSTSTASSSEERDDIITTGGHVSPVHSPTPILVNLSETSPTPIGCGSNVVAKGNNGSSSGNDATDLLSSNSDGGLSQFSFVNASLPLNFPLPPFTSAAPIRLSTGPFQLLTAPQSSNSGTSLLPPSASKPPSSASIPSSSCSSGQPVPVITSHVLPMPPYQPFNPSSNSELNPDLSFLYTVS